MLELLKIMVQPVVLERGEDGDIVGERVGEVIALYAPEQIYEFVRLLKSQLEEGEANAGNGSNSAPDRMRQPGVPGQRAGPDRPQGMVVRDE